MEDVKGNARGPRHARLGLTWKFMLLVVVCVASVNYFWWDWSLGRADQLQKQQQEQSLSILVDACNRSAFAGQFIALGDRALSLLNGVAEPATLLDPRKTPQVQEAARKACADPDAVFLCALGPKLEPVGDESARFWSEVPPELRPGIGATVEPGVLREVGSTTPLRRFFRTVQTECLLVVRPVPGGADGGGGRLGLLLLGYSTRSVTSKMAEKRLDSLTQNKWDENLRMTQDEMQAIKLGSLWYACILLLAAIVATLLVGRWIASPLKSLERTVADVDRDWDLTRRAQIHTQDEIGRLAQVFNRMINRISELVQRLQEASLQVGSSSSELLAASEEISQGARNQAKHIEDTSSAVTELSASISQMAGNARKATETARKGGESINKVVEHMSRIRHTVEETSEKIKELGRSSKEIGKIVGVITQISDQTSLLALNAAIEAARAGEHGKGFAVVADEVSKLADRVSRSAKEIEDLITAIREKTEESVHSMELGTAEVETGAGLVNDAGRNFLEIVDVVQGTAASVSEQSKASEEISRLIAEILGIAKETVSATAEAVAQGNELRDLALKLEDLTKTFKVERKEAAK